MNEKDFQQHCELAAIVVQGGILQEFFLFCIERLNRGETVEEIWNAWNSR